MLRFYGVPFLLTADEGVLVLTTEEEVAGLARRQAEGLRATGYARSETLDGETTVLNACSALHTARFVRRRADGKELGRIRATYLIADDGSGPRIRALAVRTA